MGSLIRKEEGTDEPHGVSGGRVLLGTTFLIVMGLGFTYQQAADIARVQPICANQQLKTDRQTKNDEIRAKESAAEKPDEELEIAKAISACRSSLDEKDISCFANIVREESNKCGYDWELILAIIRTESKFDVQAKSNKGAIGLMQVMPNTAKWLSPRLGLKYGGLSSLYDPRYNVKLGTHYLYMMHQRFGTIEKALAAYNRGPTGLTRYLAQGRKFPSRYLEKVMGYYKELKNSPDECTS